MQRAWIISCGTELTLGHTIDTDAAWLAGRLAELGLRTERICVVPDSAEALRDVIVAAAQASDVVLISGGLGPTADDLTRAALAEAAGTTLELDLPSLERLRCFFADRGRDMPESNRVQALIPRGGRALANALGTAPGIAVSVHGTPCYALPGVPFEMQAMFEASVAPELRAAGAGRVLATRTLHCFGLGESEIGQRIGDLMAEGRNPAVGTSAKLGLVDVRITATDAPPAAVERLDEAEREIRDRLKEVVFGREEQTLSSVVGELLVSAGRTVSTAESCTGGLLGELLTDTAGSSRYYVGGVVAYANQAKQRLLGVSGDLLEQHGAVSAEVAGAMASGARARLSSDYALAVTRVAGPGGGSPRKPVGLVYIALAGPAGTSVRECRFGPDSPRAVIRSRAAFAALNWLRLELMRA